MEVPRTSAKQHFSDSYRLLWGLTHDNSLCTFPEQLIYIIQTKRNLAHLPISIWGFSCSIWYIDFQGFYKVHKTSSSTLFGSQRSNSGPESLWNYSALKIIFSALQKGPFSQSFQWQMDNDKPSANMLSITTLIFGNKQDKENKMLDLHAC